MQSDFQQFIHLRESMHELTKLNENEKRILSQIKQQEKLILELEVKLDMEQEDVEKLTKMSLKYIFYSILRSKEEQLNKERREVLEATLRLQEAKISLDEYKLELKEIWTKISELSNVPAEYAELMRKKELLLRSMPTSAVKLEEMESEISNLSLLLKELKEALMEGKGVQYLLTDASESLEKAEDWGNWDLWLNGGLLSTHFKHGHIDDARTFIHNANRQLEKFNKELKDIKTTVNVEIEIGSFLTIADYWFDGLIADWIVQGKIENAQKKTLDALHKVTKVVTQLEQEVRRVEQQLEGQKLQRIRWIEEVEFKS